MTFHILREMGRDTARRLGKDVRLHLASELPQWRGPDLSRLGDALVQAVQNAIDHGIEPTAIREKSGKSSTGQIWVTFREEAEELLIVIRDDGAGVDLAAVNRKAVGLGLVGVETKLETRDTLALLFQPGFSTKKTVTEVSGRGVGLDIVQATAETFSGKVEIDTARGIGTTLTLRFPRENHAHAA